MFSVQFRKNFTWPSFCGGCVKKLLPVISFDSGFQKIVLSIYCYFLVLVNKLIWAIFNEMKWQLPWSVISLLVDPYTSNFSSDKSLPRYVIYQKFKILAILILKKESPKNTIFPFFEGPLFRNGWSYWSKCWRVLRDFCGLSKKCISTTFSKK